MEIKSPACLEGHKVLEVKSIFYDKGSAAYQFLHHNNHDYVLAIGDDKTDEDLFKVIPEPGVSIKIGSDPSKANYHLKKQSQVYEFINLLYN